MSAVVDCGVCRRTFDSPEAYMRHPCTTGDPKSLKCRWCSRPKVMDPWHLICPSCDAPQAGPDAYPRVTKGGRCWFIEEKVQPYDFESEEGT